VKKLIAALTIACSTFSGAAFARSLPATTSNQLTVTTLALPDVGSVPQGAQRIPVLALRFSSACGADATINSITLQHSGLGAVSDFLRVYAAKGTQRLTRGITVSARDPFTLSLPSTLSIKACMSVDVVIQADLSPTALAASEHRFDVTSVDAGQGTNVRIVPKASSVATRITATANPAQVSVELLDLLTPVYYGENQILARLAVTGQGGKDQQITAITLENQGSASNLDLRNLVFITADGKQASSITSSLDGRMVRLVFATPFVLKGRERKILQLKGEVRASSRKTVQWTLDASDIEAKEVRSR
jgi:hypothetical protein